MPEGIGYGKKAAKATGLTLRELSSMKDDSLYKHAASKKLKSHGVLKQFAKKTGMNKWDVLGDSQEAVAATRG